MASAMTPASRHIASAVDHNAQSAGVVAVDLLAAWETRHLVGQVRGASPLDERSPNN